MKPSAQAKEGILSVFIHLATFIAAVAILRVGEEVLVPMAISALIAFLLWPLVRRFRRWGLGKVPAVVIATILAISVLSIIGWVMTSQAIQVLRELPRYDQNIDAKVAKLKKGAHQKNALSRVAGMLQRYERELTGPAESFNGPGPTQQQPVPVRVEPSKGSPLVTVGRMAAPALAPLVTALMVLIFVIAILMQREDIEERLLRLVPPDRVGLIRKAVADASSRVYRYLAMQLAVNACYGVFIGLGLLLIGVPNVVLWGLLAMLLRFIPYIGPWLSASFPMVLAIAIEPGWIKVLCTLGLYVAAETVTANLVEPLVYGAAAGISGLALLFAAVFWTWLWGMPGLLLSTPLTVTLMVLGNYIPALRVFAVLTERTDGREGLTSRRRAEKPERDAPHAPAHTVHRS